MPRRPKPETVAPKRTRDDLEARAGLLRADRERYADALHDIADRHCSCCSPIAARALGEA